MIPNIFSIRNAIFGLLATAIWSMPYQLAQASTIGPKRFGLGFSVIDPTGPSVKYTLPNGQALESSFGWSRRGVHFHGQYLFDEVPLSQDSTVHFDLFYGAGLRVLGGERDERLGARIPVGLAATLAEVPFEFTAQLAFILNLVPFTSFDADFSITARYFF